MDDKLYLDKSGYENLLNRIESVRKKIDENNKERKSAFDAGSGDGWDSPEFEEIERQEHLLFGELQRLYDQLDRVVIVEREKGIDTVDIGDVVKVDFYYSEDDCEEESFKLTGGSVSIDSDIQEISINSPLGAAMYKKKVGDSCCYSVDGREFMVIIKEKLNLQLDDSAPSR